MYFNLKLKIKEKKIGDPSGSPIYSGITVIGDDASCPFSVQRDS